MNVNSFVHYLRRSINSMEESVESASRLVKRLEEQKECTRSELVESLQSLIRMISNTSSNAMESVVIALKYL